MEKVTVLEKERLLSRASVVAFAKFAVLLALATFLPFIKQQLIVGSLVNAVLFISAATLGPQAAIMVGLVPSLVSISVGLLPALLAPMIPFIMVSNTILIVVFSRFQVKNKWLGLISASVLKFVFLFATSNIVINLLFKKEIAKQVSLMMSYPQLITALVGGVIALTLLAGLKSWNKK
jgi:hypothetical protein